MKIKTTFAALALIAAPTLTLAKDCAGDRAMQDAKSINCAVGATYDAATNTCVPGTNS